MSARKTNTKPSPSKRSASSKTAKQAPQKKAAVKAAEESGQGFFDSRVKNDLAGMFIAVVAIAIFIAVVSPGDAILSKMIGDFFHYGFGVGAYVLPFALLVWGASFFVRQTFTSSTLRLGIGLLIIFVSVITLVAINTVDAGTDPQLLFQELALVSHGGYVGAGIAWMLLTLVGKVISWVLLVGLIIGGLIIIGFSITGLVERITSWLGFGQKEEAYDQGEYARIKMPRPPRHEAAPTARLRSSAAIEDDGIYDEAFEEGAQGKLPLSEGAGGLGATRRFSRGDSAAGKASDRATKILGAKRSDGDAGTSSEKTQHSNKAADGYVLPDPKYLKVSKTKSTSKAGENELRQTAARLQETLDEFSVDGEVVGWIAGPTVTLYKVSLEAGVRLNKITNLSDDIALALAATAVRIMAPIPGTSLVGIEIPNTTRNSVLLGDALPPAGTTPLLMGIGKDVEGDVITADLAKMPHLLIGGTTGSGKSVAINSMIMSILMRSTPAEVRMILIDPKRVELSLYNGIPHLYVPVVTDAEKAASALAWGVVEMERRLKVFEKVGVRNIGQFNTLVRDERGREEQAGERGGDADEKGSADSVKSATGAGTTVANPTRKLKGGAKSGAVDSEDLQEEMPFIVIVIDELADLMMVAGKEVEASICRIAQLARAAGIHLIVATQRPSTNVITGLIKANITNRIAFNVASGIDSRVILDTPGAENLIGLGDLLFSKPEYGKPVRIQGCYVGESEIETVVKYLRTQGEPDYHEEILATKMSAGSVASFGGSDDGSDDDPLVWEAAEIVVSGNLGSTSTLQRRLKVGYARAGRIMDMLEAKGVVGPPNGSKPRDVLVDTLELESLKAFEAGDSAGNDDW